MAKRYNPYAYVPGNAPPNVARAIQKKGYATARPAAPPVAARPDNRPGPFGADPINPTPTGGGGGGGGDPTHADFTVPGFTPDYESLIKGNWGYKQFLDNSKAQRERDLGFRNDAFRSGVVNSGYDLSSWLANNPDLAKALGGVVDPTTLAAAQGNSFSQAALEQRQFGMNQHGIEDRLAAMGAANSGQLGYENKNELFRHNQQDNTNVQNAIAYLAGAQKAFLETEGGRDSGLVTARNAAATEETTLHPPTGEKAAHWSDADGAYADAQGNLYDPDTHQLIPGRKAGQSAWAAANQPAAPVPPISSLPPEVQTALNNAQQNYGYSDWPLVNTPNSMGWV